MSWNALGTITPTTLGVWHTFGPLAMGSRPTVRITFPTVSPADRFLSWLWFRCQLTYNGEISYTPLFRIYPTADPELRELFIPTPFRDLEGAIWRPQIQKRIKWRGLAGTTTETPWAVTISQWDATPQRSPLSVSWRVEDMLAFGYAAEILVYNASSEPIENWTIQFEADDNITNTWGADLDAMGANTWAVTPSITGGSPVIYPGETRVVGLVSEGDNPPSLRNLRVTSASPGGWDDGPDTPLFFDGGEY